MALWGSGVRIPSAPPASKQAFFLTKPQKNGFSAEDSSTRIHRHSPPIRVNVVTKTGNISGTVSPDIAAVIAQGGGPGSRLPFLNFNRKGPVLTLTAAGPPSAFFFLIVMVYGVFHE